MTIFSYFGVVPELDLVDEVKLCLHFLKVWRSAGFDPFILTEHDARKHPLFEKLHEAVSKFPTTNPKSYEESCYMRWLAMAQVGGGILCDLDVAPIKSGKWLQTLVTKQLHSGRLGVLQKKNVCPSLVIGTAENYEDQAWLFANYRPPADLKHTSDMIRLESRVMENPDAVDLYDLVRCYGETTPETCAIHFNNGSAGPAGLTPRWKHLPEILEKLRT